MQSNVVPKKPKAENKSKELLTEPNAILGSLATIGVLGMADILIYKGKHLNKLTGKNKQLQEALGKTATAETKLKALKKEALDFEKTIKELGEMNSTANGHKKISMWQAFDKVNK